MSEPKASSIISSFVSKPVSNHLYYIVRWSDEIYALNHMHIVAAKSGERGQESLPGEITCMEEEEEEEACLPACLPLFGDALNSLWPG